MICMITELLMPGLRNRFEHLKGRDFLADAARIRNDDPGHLRIMQLSGSGQGAGKLPVHAYGWTV